MAGGDGWFSDARRRWALAGVGVVVVAAAIFGTTLIAGDSDPADPAPTPVAQSEAPVTTTTEDATDAPDENRGRARDRDRGADEAANRDTKKTDPAGDGGSDGNRSSPASDEEAPPTCPQGLSPSQCNALAAAIEQAGAGTPIKEGKCPPGLSHEDCVALGEAYEQASEGVPIKEGRCPPGLTREQCAALGG